MKILLTSDTHRGFDKNTALIHKKWGDKALKKLEFDVLVLAGDIGTSKLKDMEGALKFFRELTDKPILWVKGNHDWWARQSGRGHRTHTWEQVERWHAHCCQKFNIHDLDDGPYSQDGVHFVGWGGWYIEQPARANDSLFVESYWKDRPWVETMKEKERKDIERVLGEIEEIKKSEYDKIVAVTHFPIVPHLPKSIPEFNGNPRHWQFFEGQIDYLLMGHTHQRVEGIDLRGTKLYNAGSDYDKPAYIIINTEDL